MTNYHQHTQFCDARNTMQEFVEEAIAKGFTQLGFSPHSPSPFADEELVKFEWTMSASNMPNYLQEVDRLQKLYPQIKLLKGLEVDSYGQETLPASYYATGQFDYLIASVHMLKTSLTSCGFAPIDSSGKLLAMLIEELGSAKKLYQFYFASLAAMLEAGNVAMIGHLDIINKGNQNKEFFDYDSEDFKQEVLQILDLAKQKEVAIEINTGYIKRKNMREPLPSYAILESAIKIGNALVLNSDCHNVGDIDFGFETIGDRIKAMGGQLATYSHNGKFTNFL